MIKYTETLKEICRTCGNPVKNLGVSYQVIYNILADTEIKMKSLLKIINKLNLSIEDCVYYEKD